MELAAVEDINSPIPIETLPKKVVTLGRSDPKKVDRSFAESPRTRSRQQNSYVDLEYALAVGRADLKDIGFGTFDDCLNVVC